MTLQEVLRLGKLYKRPSHVHWYSEFEFGQLYYVSTDRRKSGTVSLKLEDLLAEDWEYLDTHSLYRNSEGK